MQTQTAQHLEKLVYQEAKRRGYPVEYRPDFEESGRSDSQEQTRMDEGRRLLEAARQRRVAKIAANGKKSMEG
ncbi:MAG: hypothetical protein Kow00121_60570 [Elainellaceae cyanobacterium]